MFWVASYPWARFQTVCAITPAPRYQSGGSILAATSNTEDGNWLASIISLKASDWATKSLLAIFSRLGPCSLEASVACGGGPGHSVIQKVCPLDVRPGRRIARVSRWAACPGRGQATGRMPWLALSTCLSWPHLALARQLFTLDRCWDRTFRAQKQRSAVQS